MGLALSWRGFDFVSVSLVGLALSRRGGLTLTVSLVGRVCLGFNFDSQPSGARRGGLTLTVSLVGRALSRRGGLS